MVRFGRIILLTLGLGLTAVALSFFPRHPVAAAPDPPAIPVNVENTPTVNAHITNASVPVTGSVNAAVTGAVSITGTPMVEVTSLPPITTAGSVTVSNTPTSAIPVVQAPIGSNIYASTCSANTTADYAVCSLTTISSNMVLYVESATISTSSSSVVVQGFIASPQGATIAIPMIAQGQNTPGTYFFTGQMAGAAHFAGGASPTCTVALGDAAANVQISSCSIFGYLVPAS